MGKLRLKLTTKLTFRKQPSQLYGQGTSVSGHVLLMWSDTWKKIAPIYCYIGIFIYHNTDLL